MIPNYQNEARIKKLHTPGMTRDKALQLIWGWIKQPTSYTLTLREFKELLKHVPVEHPNDED